jgi:hypothetical protein
MSDPDRNPQHRRGHNWFPEQPKKPPLDDARQRRPEVQQGAVPVANAKPEDGLNIARRRDSRTVDKWLGAKKHTGVDRAKNPPHHQRREDRPPVPRSTGPAMTALLTHARYASNVEGGAEHSVDGGYRPRKPAGFLCPDSTLGLPLWRGCEDIRRFGARITPPVHQQVFSPRRQDCLNSSPHGARNSHDGGISVASRTYHAVRPGALAGRRAP